VEITSPHTTCIDYSPFICEAGRPCAGCREYYEWKRNAEKATAMKKGSSSSPLASNRSMSPLSDGSEDEDLEDEVEQDEDEGDSDEEQEQDAEDGDSDDNYSDSPPLTPV